MRLSGAWAVASPRALASSPQGKANLVGAWGKLFVLRGGGGWTTVWGGWRRSYGVASSLGIEFRVCRKGGGGVAVRPLRGAGGWTTGRRMAALRERLST